MFDFLSMNVTWGGLIVWAMAFTIINLGATKAGKK